MSLIKKKELNTTNIILSGWPVAPTVCDPISSHWLSYPSCYDIRNGD